MGPFIILDRSRPFEKFIELVGTEHVSASERGSGFIDAQPDPTVSRGLWMDLVRLRDVQVHGGLSGPILGASGVPLDLRKLYHYECCLESDWKIQWQTKGDSLARQSVRFGDPAVRILLLVHCSSPRWPFAKKQKPGGRLVNCSTSEINALMSDTFDDVENSIFALNHGIAGAEAMNDCRNE